MLGGNSNVKQKVSLTIDGSISCTRNRHFTVTCIIGYYRTGNTCAQLMIQPPVPMAPISVQISNILLVASFRQSVTPKLEMLSLTYFLTVRHSKGTPAHPPHHKVMFCRNVLLLKPCMLPKCLQPGSHNSNTREDQVRKS